MELQQAFRSLLMSVQDGGSQETVTAHAQALVGWTKSHPLQTCAFVRGHMEELHALKRVLVRRRMLKTYNLVNGAMHFTQTRNELARGTHRIFGQFLRGISRFANIMRTDTNVVLEALVYDQLYWQNLGMADHKRRSALRQLERDSTLRIHIEYEYDDARCLHVPIVLTVLHDSHSERSWGATVRYSRTYSRARHAYDDTVHVRNIDADGTVRYGTQAFHSFAEAKK